MSNSPNEIVTPDLASSRFKADPCLFYAGLHAEAPVWRGPYSMASACSIA
jgi:hypothetical protein